MLEGKRVCAKCKTINVITKRYCQKCGAFLKLQNTIGNEAVWEDFKKIYSTAQKVEYGVKCRCCGQITKTQSKKTPPSCIHCYSDFEEGVDEVVDISTIDRIQAPVSNDTVVTTEKVVAKQNPMQRRKSIKTTLHLSYISRDGRDIVVSDLSDEFTILGKDGLVFNHINTMCKLRIWKKGGSLWYLRVMEDNGNFPLVDNAKLNLNVDFQITDGMMINIDTGDINVSIYEI